MNLAQPPALSLLLIEDDPMIGQSLKRALSDASIQVDWRRDGLEGARAMASGHFSLILLDLGLPNRDGIQLLQQFRHDGRNTPLLIITARDEVDDLVNGLEAGADDYVVKPFSFMELMARIRAVLRRTGEHPPDIVSNGEIFLNLQTFETRYRDKSHVLPMREFTLLHILTDSAGLIFSREQLETRLYEWNREVTRNAVEVLIHCLRKKFDHEIIRNVRGIGWMVLKHPL